jgi:hypothetical protein
MVARLYLDGENPYTPSSLKQLKRSVIGHPPTTAFWYIPLGYFEKAIAAELMDLSTWLLLLLHLYLCARELKFPAPVALTVLIFGWMFTTDGMTMHWHAIQISEQIAFPLTLCWIYLRRRREIAAGMALGVAATFKLFPGVVMVFLLAARRYRAFAAAAAVYLAIAAFMTATYGLAAWPMFLKLQDGIARGWAGTLRNASLQGIVLRALSPACKGTPQPTALTTVVVSVLGLALVVLAGVLSWRALKAARSGDPRQIDLPFALITVVATFLNPWIWEHYYVLMIQPAFVLVASLYGAFRRTLRAWLDEETPGRVLFKDGAAFFFVGLGLAVIAVILKTNMYATVLMQAIWRQRQPPWDHRQFHLVEVLNWLPWDHHRVLLLRGSGIWRPVAGVFHRRPVADLVEAKAGPGQMPLFHGCLARVSLMRFSCWIVV